MAFPKKDVDQLLADTGRLCCLCGRRHTVQIHHIVPKEDGGDDSIENAIPLCPNCHNEVHGGAALRRSTRAYTANELKLHRQRTVERARRQKEWTPGSAPWEQDRDLITFYAQALDRPAFRTHFHEELSFTDFDQAMEDTLLALNTGHWRTRDGTLLGRSKGKASLINPEWHEKVDRAVAHIENVRRRFRKMLGLDAMIFQLGRQSRDLELERALERRFRHDRELGRWMDEERQTAIEEINSILTQLGKPKLKGIG